MELNLTMARSMGMADGSVVSWGCAGSDLGFGEVQELLTADVECIYHANAAFAAQKADGSVVATWGEAAFAEKMTEVHEELNLTMGKEEMAEVHEEDVWLCILDGSMVVAGGEAAFAEEMAEVHEELFCAEEMSDPYTDDGVQPSAEKRRQLALASAESRQNQVAGISEKKVAEMAEKQKKAEVLGKIEEHYKRKKIDMPMGLPAASAAQLKDHWERIRKGEVPAEQLILQTASSLNQSLSSSSLNHLGLSALSSSAEPEVHEEDGWQCILCGGSDPESCPLCGDTQIPESDKEHSLADSEEDPEAFAEEPEDDEWQCVLCQGSGLSGVDDDEVCFLCGGEKLTDDSREDRRQKALKAVEARTPSWVKAAQSQLKKAHEKTTMCASKEKGDVCRLCEGSADVLNCPLCNPRSEHLTRTTDCADFHEDVLWKVPCQKALLIFPVAYNRMAVQACSLPELSSYEDYKLLLDEELDEVVLALIECFRLGATKHELYEEAKATKYYIDRPDVLDGWWRWVDTPFLEVRKCSNHEILSAEQKRQKIREAAEARHNVSQMVQRLNAPRHNR